MNDSPGETSGQHAVAAARKTQMEIPPVTLTTKFPRTKTVTVRHVALATNAKAGAATNPTLNPELTANTRLSHDSGQPAVSVKAKTVPKTALAEHVMKTRQSNSISRLGEASLAVSTCVLTSSHLFLFAPLCEPSLSLSSKHSAHDLTRSREVLLRLIGTKAIITSHRRQAIADRPLHPHSRRISARIAATPQPAPRATCPGSLLAAIHKSARFCPQA
jgi:hypothetical protein